MDTTSKKKRFISFLLLVLSFIIFPFVIQAQQTGKRAKWFVDARYGMFIHWGVYSAAEGYWKGEKLRNDNDYAEWIQYRNRIEKEEYLQLLSDFDWNTISPEAWVIMAKEAGMKYITLTAKHHDGFALWKSDVNPYNIYNYSSPKRDVLKELAVACKKHGLKLGLYYSHWIDWEHPLAWDHTKEISGLSAKDYDRYWQEKVMPQMRELLTHYGEISMVWFDMWIHHSKTIVTKKQLFQLKNLIRNLQPNCLINSRLGLSIEEDQDVDFRTLGDNELGKKKLNYPWQTPATVAHSWGYHAGDHQWKSTTALLKSLVGNVSKNGNLMLNVGPRANGEVPYEIRSRLQDIGDWLQQNGEAVYSSGAFDLNTDLHHWGTITYNDKMPKAKKVYLHVFNWPLNQQLKVTGITTAPTKVYALADVEKKALPFVHRNKVTTIRLNEKIRNPFNTVIVMLFETTPIAEKGLVAGNNRGGYAFHNNNSIATKGDGLDKAKSNYGTVPKHLLVTGQHNLKWQFYIDQPGTYILDTSFSFQNQDTESYLSISSNGKTLKQHLNTTGKTVGEPLQNWVINNFKSHRVGEITYSKEGVYDIELQLNTSREAPIQWQWLWLEPKD